MHRKEDRIFNLKDGLEVRRSFPERRNGCPPGHSPQIRHPANFQPCDVFHHVGRQFANTREIDAPHTGSVRIHILDPLHRSMVPPGASMSTASLRTRYPLTVANDAAMLHRLQHGRYGRSPRSRTPRPRRRGHPPRPPHRRIRGDARRMGAATTNTIPQSSHHRLPPDPGPPRHGIRQRIPVAMDLRGHRSLHRPLPQQTATDRRHHRPPLRDHPPDVPGVPDRSPATAGPRNASTDSVLPPRRCCTNGTPSSTSPTTKATPAGDR